jgi:hypothetical protein
LGQERQLGCRTPKACPIGSGPLHETKAERKLEMWGLESKEKNAGALR